jgi:hypothetical protein
MEVKKHMAKLRLALFGIICLLTVATASLHIVPLGEAKVAYKACDKVPSWKLKGQWIQPWWGDVSASGPSFVREYIWRPGWSQMSSEDQKRYTSGDLYYLYVDGRSVTLKVDTCYDENGYYYEKIADTEYRVFYLDTSRYKGYYQFTYLCFVAGEFLLVRTTYVTLD